MFPTAKARVLDPDITATTEAADTVTVTEAIAELVLEVLEVLVVLDVLLPRLIETVVVVTA